MKTEDKTCNHSKEEKKLTKQSKIALRRERIDVSNWALSRVRRATAPSPVFFCLLLCREPQHAGASLAGHRPHQQNSQTDSLQLPGESHQDPQLSSRVSARPVGAAPSHRMGGTPLPGSSQSSRRLLHFLRDFMFWMLAFSGHLTCVCGPFWAPQGRKVSCAGWHTSHQYAKTCLHSMPYLSEPCEVFALPLYIYMQNKYICIKKKKNSKAERRKQLRNDLRVGCEWRQQQQKLFSSFLITLGVVSALSEHWNG